MSRRIIISLGLFLAALSCSKEGIPYPDSAPDRFCTVDCRLSIAGEEMMTAPLTRSVNDPDDPAETQIRNCCILQYRGTDENAEIVGEVQYLSVDVDPEDDEHYLNFNSLRLAESQGETHTVVFLANTFKKLPQISTLGEIKEIYRTLSSEEDVLAQDGTGYAYQRMGAICVSPITTGTVLRGVLRRSVARITAVISNDGTDGLSILGARLCSVSCKDRFMMDFRYLDPTTAEERLLFETPAQEPYNPARPSRMDWDVRKWTGNPDGTGTASFTWYVPANLGGTDPSVQSVTEKNRSGCTEGATCLCIVASCGPDNRLILYRYYLGANLTDDFNLRPNGAYTYVFPFSGKGSPYADSRIEVLSEDLNIDANCYILNPPPAGIRTYTLNVVHRPNIFWGKRYGLSQTYSGNYLSAADTWHARLIWSDFAMTEEEAAAFLTQRTGTGAGRYSDGNQRVRINVPAGMKGNVIFGIYKDNPDEMLWSWHLWITDYEPDRSVDCTPKDGLYLYAVPGGEVHRYANDAFSQGGLYEKGFIMDRNLGAWDIYYHPDDQTGGGFYYQYGRKDPFSSNCALWLFDADNAVTYQEPTSVPFPLRNSNYQGITGTVPQSVSYPRLFYNCSGAWTTDSFNNAWYWNDPYNELHADYEEAGNNGDKSFFDPCPPGWRLPVMFGKPEEVWMHGIHGERDNSTTSTYYNCIYDVESLPSGRNRGLGYTYYPGSNYVTEKNNPDAQTIFFPDQGRREYGIRRLSCLWGNAAGITRNSRYVFYTHAYSYHISGDSIQDQNTERSAACNIRCIKL